MKYPGQHRIMAETCRRLALLTKGSHPEAGYEEVVGQDCYRENIKKLPSQEARIEVSRLSDQAAIKFRGCADTDETDDKDTKNKSTLNRVRYERDFEATDCWQGIGKISTRHTTWDPKMSHTCIPLLRQPRQ